MTQLIISDVPARSPEATRPVRRSSVTADWATLLTAIPAGRLPLEFGGNHTIYMQGAPADGIYFILAGKVRLTAASPEGREAIIATLGPGEFFGEGCIAGAPARMKTATSVGACTLTKVDKSTMVRLLRENHDVAEQLVTQLIAKVVRYEADFIDQMFNSSEKRLARMLLLLSHFGKDSMTETVVAGVNQEHLAQMVGTTRSRINLFMNRFRKRGFIEYSSDSGLTVHRGLLKVLHG